MSPETCSQRIKIIVVNEGGFASLDENGVLSYEKLGVDELLPSFVGKRLESFGYKNCHFVGSVDEVDGCECAYTVVVDITNPFIDADLVEKMVARLERYPDYDMCQSEGAIPGTEPEFVVRTEVWRSKDRHALSILRVRHETQQQYNCQLNLRKLKRIKIFKHLVRCVEGLYRMTVPELMNVLKTTEVFEQVISYFEDVPLVRVTQCPYCDGDIEPLRPAVSQPMIGYVPDDVPYHYQCVNCALIVLSPRVAAADSHKLYDLYYKEGQGTDYLVRSGSGQKHFESGLNMIKSLVPEQTYGIDLGAGSGTFVRYVRDRFPSWHIIASDFPETLDHFGYDDDIETKPLDFLVEPIGENEYDLVTAWEVVEHVPFEGFEHLLEKVHSALKPGGIFLFSTPDFDSPLCQAWDFWNLCPPHHMLVFSTTWLELYFSKHPDFDLVETVNESAIMPQYGGWFRYWETTSRNFETRAMARLFHELLEDDTTRDALSGFLDRKKWGLEVVVAVRKKK